jgi:prolyl-tRNA synthetase
MTDDHHTTEHNATTSGDAPRETAKAENGQHAHGAKHDAAQHKPSKPPIVNTSAAGKQDTKGLTVKKVENMADWYGQVVTKADVADYAPLRGFMIIKPRGYAYWQRITDELNLKIQKLGVQNAYFPLLIPESFFKKEAEHAEGFSPEVAWIQGQPGDVERFAIRPTSETIMYDSYSRWIRSWRDLPLRMNQWCNIVRWEVQDTKIFLRTREFLWQEGHCVYETEKECHKETLKYLEIYRQISEDLMAVPVILGKKSDHEKFAGAKATYPIEGLMPDGKALQMGTSHDLGQGFAKAFNISFKGKDGGENTPWQNSWGVTTRLLGAMIMMHGDDKGLVIPPRMATEKVAIVPILFDATKDATIAKAKELQKSLKRYGAFVDDRSEYSAGWKFNEHELHGIPLRIEIGPKDIEKNQCVVVRRDTGEKLFVPLPNVVEEVRRLLDAIQQSMLERAKQFVQSRLMKSTDFAVMEQSVNAGNLVLSPHCGGIDCESEIKEVTKGITTRCIPFKGDKLEPGSKCIRCDKKAKYLIYFGRAY